MRGSPLGFAMLCTALLLGGCGTAKPHHDAANTDAVQAELRTAFDRTATQMGIPPNQRPDGRTLDGELQLLAMHLADDPEALAAIRDGRMDVAAVQSHARFRLEQLAVLPGEHKKPPALMAYLADLPNLDQPQCLLLHAFSLRVAGEGHLRNPTGSIPTGPQQGGAP